MAKTTKLPSVAENPFTVLDRLGLSDQEQAQSKEIEAFTRALDDKHARTIAVVNYKGGVGKTTATFFLGAQVAHHEPKKKVLIVDIDAQCSLTTVFGQDPITGNDQNVLVLLKGGKAINPASIKREAFIKKGKYGSGIPANLFLLSGAFEVEDLDYELAQDKTMSKDEFFKQCRRVLALFHDFDQEKLGEDPKSGALFVFGNRRHNRLKILYFDGTGVCVLAKRLEEGTFSWPQSAGESKAKVRLAPQALQLLLDGVDLKAGARRAWYECAA